MLKRRASLPLLAALAIGPAAPALHAQTALELRVDSAFTRYANLDSPGCAVGVAEGGRVVLERAYGMADLERNVPITTATIFEAGSVSKQFTAAAVLLLARDGRLSLDDDVRRWVPEVHDFGTTITLRHLLHHISGLRDWGSVAGIAGWPRNTRALSHAHVLQIISRLTELNFPPGTEYEYSNTNYNLLAMVVERASGTSFPEFTRARLFEPLGMSKTSWRDDAMRLVPGRALSYGRAGAGWESARAVENIYGNCCLLTTVGDLLTWNAAFDRTRLGPGLREDQERRGVLSNGRAISYAAGLFVNTYRGQRQVAHSGATAGYRAYAARYPEAGVSVAVLCNAGDANPTTMGDAAAAALVPFAEPPEDPPGPARAAVPAAAIADKAGLYRNSRNMQAQRLVVRDGRLVTEPGGIELIPVSPTEFAAARGGNRARFTARAGGRYDLILATPAGDTVPADLVDDADTSAAALGALVGTYHSPEAEATLTIESGDGGGLVLRRAPDLNAPLRPLYRDGFASPVGVVVFTRDVEGRADGLRVTAGRVRNLRFLRRDGG